MKRAGVVCAVVAMFGLTAAKCTPEQVAEVEAHYRASIEAERSPTITVTASCDKVTVHAEGWPDGSWIAPAIQSGPGEIIHTVDGVADWSFLVWGGYQQYYWSVGGHLPGEDLALIVDSDWVDCQALDIADVLNN